MTVVQCMLLTAGIESCIRCGLIQSNTGYEALFEVSGIRAQITDTHLHTLAASVPGIRFRRKRCGKLSDKRRNWTAARF